MTMIGAKNLAAMARQWRRLPRRKRITLPSPSEEQALNTNNNNNNNAKSGNYCKNAASSKAEKGHFVVYTADSRRFVLPLAYLDNVIFRELLKLAEEEFGLPRNRPLTLPLDSVFIDYLMWLNQRNVGSDVLEKALLTSIPTARCCLSCPYPHVQDIENNPQLVIRGF